MGVFGKLVGREDLNLRFGNAFAFSTSQENKWMDLLEKLLETYILKGPLKGQYRTIRQIHLNR